MRRLCLGLACALVVTSPALASTSLGDQNYCLSVASDTTCPIANVAPGNAIGVLVLNQDSSSRTFTITDECGHTYGAAEVSTPQYGVTSRNGALWLVYAATCTDASMDVFVDQSATHLVYGVIVFRVSGSGTLSADTESNFDQTVAAATFVSSADTTVIDTAADVFVVSGCVGDASLGGSEVATNNGTLFTESHAQFIAKYYASASALTDERGTFSFASSRTGDCLIASIKNIDAAGGPPINSLMLLKVGR